MLPDRFEAPATSPGARSPLTMTGSCASSSPLTPGTVASLTPTVYSASSRAKRLTRKLSFWRKDDTSAADVRNALRALQTSHQKYSAAAQNALDQLRNWSTQLGAPPKFPREWQARLADPELKELLLCVAQAMYPVHAADATLTQILADLTSAFRSLGYYEENCKRVAEEAAAADRRFYKERRRLTRKIEAGNGSRTTCEAETLAAGELAVHENACLGLKMQMDNAGEQYRRQCQTELPRQFIPVLGYKQQMEDVLNAAIATVQTARIEYPLAAYDDVRAMPAPAPAPSGLYTPPPASAPVSTQPLRYASPLRSASSPSPRPARTDLYTPGAASGCRAWK